MSTLTIPVQTKQTLTGTYAKSGNDLYFISKQPPHGLGLLLHILYRPQPLFLR